MMVLEVELKMSTYDTEDTRMTLLTELIDVVARAVVDHPDEVVTKEIASNRASVIELRVARGDEGQVIGKYGATADAMRTLLRSAAIKLGKRAYLEIVDHEYGSAQRRSYRQASRTSRGFNAL